MVTNLCFRQSSTSNFIQLFEQFHLQSSKYGQVLKVKQCYELMVQKGHLTKEGWHVLVLQKTFVK
jgi:mRNA deadenylase 3'-5' endonuclease subunit Ccr4